MKKIYFLLALIYFSSSVYAECLVNQIDINFASQKELEKLDGIGPAYAQRIVESRPFSSLEDLIRVRGIGNRTLDRIKRQGLACVSVSSQNDGGISRINETIEPFSPIENNEEKREKANETNETNETTSYVENRENIKEENIIKDRRINLNLASQKELENLIGVGPSTARAIIESRPFSSLDDLLRVFGIGPVTLEKIKQQGLAYVEKRNESPNEIKQPKIDQLAESENQEKENIIKLTNQEEKETITTGKVIYESRTEIVRKYAIYGFSILLVGIIFLILKK